MRRAQAEPMNALWLKTVVWLRDAEWLTRDRAAAYCRIIFAVTFGLALLWIALSHDGVDPKGKPVGTDFVSFWTASKIALGGRPADVYDIAVHQGEQTALFSRDVGYSAFFYPPPFLLICLPLATLPYLWSLAAWLGVTGFAYWRVARAWLGVRFAALPILAFPAVLSNLGHGQNAFLSAALLGGGALMLNARPVLAGVCLGALVYKPHLAIVVPFALLAARRWQTLFAAAATAAGFCLASLAVFGMQTWRAFLEASPKARLALEYNMVGNEKMQSVFAAARLLHGGLIAAYAAQIVVALAVCAALVGLPRRSFRSDAEGPAMVAAALLTSPFLLDYDLVLLAIPLAWIARESLVAGFLPWEKTVLGAAFILPALSRSIASLAGIPLGPLTVLAVFLLVLRRADAQALGRMRGPEAAAPSGVGNSAVEGALSLAGER
jgi:alpha-1,2-mannosyltransferase